MPVHFLDRVHRPASGPVAVGIVLEVSLEDRLDHHLGSSLNHTITNSRNAERTLATIRFGDHHPPHRIRSVCFRDQFLAQARQPCFQALLLDLSKRHPLRRRMIKDMTIRKFAPKTQHDYVQRVKNFAAFLGRSPDLASFEDVRRYQLHLAASGVGVPTLNQTVSTLRFFFRVTLRRHEIVEHTHVIHEPRKLPVVLSPEEVARLLDAAPGLKYKAALSVAYGAGLRANEVVSLKISDIDSKRMIIRVEQGKGRKDRNVMLSPHLLDLLRAWWRAARPQGWLFPARDPAQPMTTRQLNRACHAAAQMAEINKRVSLHTLRHSFATHLLEQNIDVRVIQVLLGHAKLDTTALYTRVATKTISEVMSPLEHIAIKLKEARPPG